MKALAVENGIGLSSTLVLLVNDLQPHLLSLDSILGGACTKLQHSQAIGIMTAGLFCQKIGP